jgi:plasmid stabilization system protein ParE
MFEIIWTEFAVTELRNIYLYYLTVASKRVANKIRKSIFLEIKILESNPFSFQIEENLISLNQKHRYLIVKNYKVIYLISKERKVYITDIFDCRQNPEKMNR